MAAKRGKSKPDKKTNDPEQATIPGLEVESVEHKRETLTRRMAEFFIQEHRIQKIRGELKLENNTLKEIKADLKDLTVDVEKGQLELVISEAKSQVANRPNDRQIMDQSSIRTAEELRRHPNSEASFTEGGEEDTDDDQDEE